MWRLCEHACGQENNRGIFTFFLGALVQVMHDRPEWAVAQILALDERLSTEDKESQRDLNEAVVRAFLRLWLAHDRGAAAQRVRSWLADPVQYRDRVQIALSALRECLTQGDPEQADNRDNIVRRHSIAVFHAAVAATASVFNDLARRPVLDDGEQQQAKAALHILDTATTEIYFGSGAYYLKNPREGQHNAVFTTSGTRQRFLKELGPTLEMLADIAHPAVTHHLLETLDAYIPENPARVFQLVIRVLLSGGRGGGYQFESLGADLFVSLVRRYLADYRDVLTGDAECRAGLIRALDIFAEVGWPEARRLVYELPEMLR